MQPPPRLGAEGSADVVGGEDDESILARIDVWARDLPDGEASGSGEAIKLCDDLRRRPVVPGQYVDEVARTIHRRHATDAGALVALGRLQLAVRKLSDAQHTLTLAGRVLPEARGPHRYLGEVLLRRGDAVRAARMFERALEIETRSGERGDEGEEPTAEWLVRAARLTVVQETSGEAAVIGELATILGGPGPSPRVEPARLAMHASAPAGDPSGRPSADSAAMVVTTGEILTNEVSVPAIPSPEIDSVPLMRTAPPPDHSPEAEVEEDLPKTVRMRALRPEAVTLSEEAPPAPRPAAGRRPEPTAREDRAGPTTARSQTAENSTDPANGANEERASTLRRNPSGALGDKRMMLFLSVVGAVLLVAILATVYLSR